MKRNNKRSMVLLGIFILLLVTLIGILLFVGQKSSKKAKIGFIMTGSIDEEGWNGMHYQGVSAACKALDVELIVKENVKEFEGTCEAAVEELVKQDCKLIILTSYNYAEEVKELFAVYPDVSFYVTSVEYHADNVISYFVRMYQVRYLAGIIAGLQTQTDQIGYVAAMPNSEVNRGINAFTMGVRRVNPDATVTVAWSNSWDDEGQERRQANRLIEEVGVDVLTCHQNQSYSIEEAEKAGIYSIGYHHEPANHSAKYLTTVMADWKLTYEAIIRQYLRGNTASMKVYWVGIDEDTVKLDNLSAAVSREALVEVPKARNELLAGKDVFSGVIYDREGNLRCKENQVIRDEVLLEQLDWYVEGVEFYDR